jgi:hypothetical protein
MKKHRRTSTENPEAKMLTQRIDAVPAIHKLPLVDELTALAISYRLRANNPALREQINLLIERLTAEVVEQFDQDPETGDYIVRKLEMKGAVAKILHRVAAAVALSVGDSLLEAQALAEHLAISEVEESGPLTGILEPQTQEGF